MTQADSDQARWNRRYAGDAVEDQDPSRLLVGLGAELVRSGRALDLAGGRGRNALWLAARGMEVTLCDASDVALGQAAGLAARRGVQLATVQRDVIADGPPPASAAQPLWDLIVCFNFIDRPLYARLPVHVKPGGQLLIVHPTTRNLERHARPSARLLLGEGELKSLVPGVHVQRYDEGWLDDEHHLSLMLAVRPSAGAELKR